MKPSPSLLLAAATLLASCDGAEQQGKRQVQQAQVNCADRPCPGDVAPRIDAGRDVALKLNGRWFVGPRAHFSSANNAAYFEWWSHRPVPAGAARPPEMQALATAGKGNEFSIDIHLRSQNVPPDPRGYRLIELAQDKQWIASHKEVRPGLDVIQMKHVVGPTGKYMDHVTYYVATTLRGGDGLPPVAVCNHDHPENGGGGGFMWRPGIWAGIRMNQRHCADWPEVYAEVVRVLQLLKEKPMDAGALYGAGNDKCWAQGGREENCGSGELNPARAAVSTNVNGRTDDNLPLRLRAANDAIFSTRACA